MHSLMQVSAENGSAENVVMWKCITYALPYADFGRFENAGFKVMQECISYAHA